MKKLSLALIEPIKIIFTDWYGAILLVGAWIILSCSGYAIYPNWIIVIPVSYLVVTGGTWFFFLVVKGAYLDSTNGHF